MGFATKRESENGPNYLEIPFDAFKFPTSDVVQFRALVTPCLTACDPVFCVAQSYDGKIQEMNSYGRRRRREAGQESTIGSHNNNNITTSHKKEAEEEVVVTSIKIKDAFFKNDKDKIPNSPDNNGYNYYKVSEEIDYQMLSNATCINMTGLTIACVVFLLVQMILMLLWVLCWYRKSRQSSTTVYGTSAGSGACVKSIPPMYSFTGPMGDTTGIPRYPPSFVSTGRD